jgi:hypothetical protein
VSATPKPIPERVEAQPLRPRCAEPDINEVLDGAHEAMRRGQAQDLAEMVARFLDRDHEQALQIHAAFERERLDPEGCERERRADRREAEQL